MINAIAGGAIYRSRKRHREKNRLDSRASSSCKISGRSRHPTNKAVNNATTGSNKPAVIASKKPNRLRYPNHADASPGAKDATTARPNTHTTRPERCFC